jgi:conjugative transposon TraN protein
MKKIVSLILLCWFFQAVSAQQPLGSLPLKITDSKTTFLIFPFTILHVDRGTNEVLAQQVNEAKNILLVKASICDFKNTNLTVVTEDGAVYPFDVSYEPFPANSVYRLSLQSVYKVLSGTSGQAMNIRDLESVAHSILNKRKSISGIKDKQWEMVARVKGIYIKDEVIFYQFGLKNLSPINYDIDLIRFYIRDQKKGKRTASQEIEVKPIYVAGNTKQVKAGQDQEIVFAMDKFTIPDAKIFFIEIMEKNGGRHLCLKVKNNKIVKAEILPEASN